MNKTSFYFIIINDNFIINIKKINKMKLNYYFIL